MERKDDANGCVKNALRKRTTGREPTAHQLFGVLSACARHGNQRAVRVTKPRNALALDGVIDTMLITAMAGGGGGVLGA